MKSYELIIERQQPPCLNTFFGHPEQLQGRYAKGFFLSEESKTMETCKPKCSLTPWFDEQCIRWDKNQSLACAMLRFRRDWALSAKTIFSMMKKAPGWNWKALW